jgi:hypothetical protein
VLSGRGLCVELITRPEEYYRLCCIVVCDLETSRIGAPYIYDISSLRVKGSSGEANLNILWRFLQRARRNHRNHVSFDGVLDEIWNWYLSNIITHVHFPLRKIPPLEPIITQIYSAFILPLARQPTNRPTD